MEPVNADGVARTLPRVNDTDVVTDVPMGEVLEARPAGTHALLAAIPGQGGEERPATSRWFVLSDLGIAAWAGSKETTGAVRSLADAGGVEGATVRLVSRASGELGTAVTDARGVATFSAGLVRGGGEAPALVDASLVTDRGAHRAGRRTPARCCATPASLRQGCSERTR